MRVSVIGLGKLGSPLAALLAHKGHQVIGVDVNPTFVQMLARGEAPVFEPGLQELIDASRSRLTATSSYGEAVLASDVTFVIVPTPSDSKGAFSNRHVLASLKELGSAIRKKASYHVVSIVSTVMPGSTGGEIRATLEEYSGRTVGVDVGLCYNPEFVALGSVLRDMLRPDFILIGESDARAGDVLSEIYRSTSDNNPPVRRMNFVNAELTKISVNTFVTTRISWANMLADLCDRLAGADVDVVTGALGMDSRIGGKYLKGALGYGGPCFPRDNVAFSHLARTLGAKPDLAEATDRINHYQIDRLTAVVEAHGAPGCRVGILGLSYKPDTGVVEASQGVMLASRLADRGFSVSVFDPLAMPAALAVLGPKAKPANSAQNLVEQVDVLVVATAWPEFGKIPVSAFARSEGKLVVVDCWRALPGTEIDAVAQRILMGRGDMPQEALSPSATKARSK